MGRNYFSKAGGPYFINDGFSKHTDHDHKTGHTHDDIKPDISLAATLAITFLSLCIVLSIVILATL